MKNNFEQLIKESLDSHEIPYKEGAWESFEKSYSPLTPFYKSKWFISGAAMLLIAIVAYQLIPVENNSIEKNSLSNTTESLQDHRSADVIIQKENSTDHKLTAVINEATEPSISENTEFTTDINKPNAENKNNDELVNPSQKTEPSQNPDSQKEETTPATQSPSQVAEKNTEVKTSEMISAEFYLAKTICQGNRVNLVSEENNPNYTYTWKINDNQILTGANTSFIAKQEGITTILLAVMDKGGKQVASKSSIINILELPSANIEITNNEGSLINEYLFTNFDNANQITWNFGDGTVSVNPSEKHTYKKAGNYTCKYTVTNSEGCSIESEHKIDVKGYYNIRTDYGFSPNGDNINDEFIPEELKVLNRPFEMNVYARNGQLLYSTNTIDRPWNGKMLDGTKASFGSYVWVISITNELGIKEVYKGTITNVSN